MSYMCKLKIKQHIRKDEFLELNEWQTRNLLDLLKEVSE